MIGDNGLLFGWSEQTWLWLDQAGILLGNSALVLTFLAAVAGVLKRESIRRWLRSNRFPAVGGEVEDMDEDIDALVFTVSREEVPRFVMERLEPGAAVFLATAESEAVAKQLEKFAREAGCDAGIRRIDDPDDPAESRDQAALAIRGLRRRGYRRVGVDVTGGKAPMSIGAFMAAEEAGCPTLYVSAPYDRQLNKPDMRRARIRCISQPAEVP